MQNICSTKNLLLFPLINISRILLQVKHYWFNSSMKTEKAQLKYFTGRGEKGKVPPQTKAHSRNKTKSNR